MSVDIEASPSFSRNVLQKQNMGTEISQPPKRPKLRKLPPTKMSVKTNHPLVTENLIVSKGAVGAENGVYSNGKEASLNSLVKPNMNSEEERLNTFTTWPTQAPIGKERLAKAGFFYAGHETEVQCFSCGIPIGEWSYNDIAMDKHKKFSPQCDFVNNKSDNIPFIAQNPRTAASPPAIIMRGPCSFDQHLEVNERNYPMQYDEHRRVSKNFETNRDRNVLNGVTENHTSASTSRPAHSTSNGHSPLVNGINGNTTTSTEFQGSSNLSTASTGLSCGMTTNENGVQIMKTREPHVRTVTNGITTSPVTTEFRPMMIRSPVEAVESRMKYEAERLKTFGRNWPLTFLEPSDLARAGFFYLQMQDKCCCAFCRGVLKNWRPGDVASNEHIKSFPTCPFVMGLNVGNVPMNGIDVCGYRIMPNSDAEKKVNNFQNGLFLHSGPAHPSQATLDARLRSFQTWPKCYPLKPEYLAEAGFFYTNIRDNVKCFYCDTGLCNWEPGDDAWVEHGRWAKECSYVVLMKGQEFVNSCEARSEIASSRSRVEESQGPFSSAVEEAMQSDLIKSVVKTHVFAPFLIRKALQRKFETTGSGVNSVNELSEAVMVEMEEQTRRPPITEPAVCNAVTTNGETIVNGTGNAVASLHSELSPEDELQQLKDSRICKVCLDREIEVVFLPCGHQLACRTCALALKECAVCRQRITGIIRTFLP